MSLQHSDDRLAEFNTPAAVIVGAGAVAQLGAQIQRLRCARVLIVADPFLVKSGLVSSLTQTLRDDALFVTVWDGVQPDPTDVNVRAVVAELAEHACDVIVVVGGGSALDTAKAAAVLITNGEPLSAMEGAGKVRRPGLPVIAIPTTAGTGSEVTKVAVITDTERDVKMLLLDPHVLPTVALVDFTLTLSMPRALTAHVGIDTLTHGIEAYVSRRATPLSDPLALRCIQLSAENLEAACDDPANRAARANMMLAATLGGMAFTNSSVALVHAMSRPIGALFHVPHGLSNAVLLPTVVRYSLAGAPERYADVARAMGCATASDSTASAGAKLLGRLEALNDNLNVPRLRDCVGVPRDPFYSALTRMAGDALGSGSASHNPIVPDVEQIEALYREAY